MGSKNKPIVSIVIRCFNEERHIGKLLHGVFSQIDVPLEVIVVDSGSTDNTLEIAHQYPTKVVSISSSEFTFGRALNRGCAAAQGEFFVFASAHVYPVHKEWIKSLLKPFDIAEVGAVYGKQRGGENAKFSEQRIFDQWYPNSDITIQDTPFCNNANCAIRRGLWEQHPYNEDITGLEDLHWAQNISHQGYRVSYAADAEVIHVHNETPRQIFNRYRREAIALKFTYPEQSMSLPSFTALFSKNVIFDYFAAAKKREFLKRITEIPMFRLMQLWGAYTGFHQNGEISEKLKRTFYYPSSPPQALTSEALKTKDRIINYTNLTQPTAKPLH